MTDAGVLLVDASPDNAAALAALPGLRAVAADDVEAALAGADVAVVVVGGAAAAPIAVTQRAHRAVPDAGVVVVTTADTDEQVRRQLSYAPGVPLDVAVVGPGDDLAAVVARLGDATADRRRHQALVASVGTRAAGTAHVRPEAVQLRALFEQAPLGIVVCDPAGLLLGWNRHAEGLLRIQPSSLGVSVDSLLPGAGLVVRQLAAGGGATTTEPIAAGDVEVEVSAVTSELDDGRPVALLLLDDVTTRLAAERSRDRLAGHVDLLAEVSDVLTRTLDVGRAVELLADALVPTLGDWVLVRVGAESGQVVAVRHRDLTLAPVTRRVEQLVAPGRIVTPLGRRVATGEPVLLTGLTSADLPELLGDPELVRLVADFGASSLLAVPLRGRTDVLGALVVGAASAARQLTETELAVAAEVGRRAGTVLDNARLYARERQVATELQRSLLTDPPQPPNTEVVVRYVAAARQAQVGGDWYDAFVQPDGATVLVIGDVVGHDTRAAAAMGQLRGLLRGIAYTTGAEPAEVLTRVDAAIEGLLLGTTATAVVARLTPTDAASGEFRLEWSNAGHPPPVVIHPDGRVAVLGDAVRFTDADLLLGIDPATPRRTASATLRAGSTVLLYTDGLVERRGRSLDTGIGELVEVLAESPKRPLEETCDVSLDRLLPAEPEDDVALVAVRVQAAAP